VIDPFLVCFYKIEGEPSAELLQQEAEMFLRAGGALTLADWRDMQDCSRAAFIRAKIAVDAERLNRIATEINAEIGSLTDSEAATALADAVEKKVGP
jgi:hypothetical protein